MGGCGVDRGAAIGSLETRWNMQQRIKRKIEEARQRSLEKRRPYVIESTGRGRIKCHADAPDASCPRCRHRMIVRSLRARKAGGVTPSAIANP
jgi:predicted RNA-binding Zn-ribbon protein involved in translation (DUF1610 family)